MIPPTVSSTQISGSYVGCMAFDSMMQSTLQCFYDHQCLFQLFNQTNIKALNATLNSTFSIDTKIQTLIEQQFIENWSNEKDFESFFKECQPNRCTYSYNARGNAVFVVTLMASLVGGLFVVLKITSSLFVLVYEGIKNRVTRKFTQSSICDENDQSK